MNEELKAKVKRALELQADISSLNKQIYALKKIRDDLAAELKPIMDDPYIYDKVEGSKRGGII